MFMYSLLFVKISFVVKIIVIKIDYMINRYNVKIVLSI